ncbi:hypothetical protein CRYUN_Cryun12cG0118600 [Craigia yunnanensis]
MEGLKRKDIVKEVKKQLGLAGPLFVVFLLQYSLQIISVMFVGHLGELAVSSASIASSFVSVIAFNLLTGMATALETLCGQNFGAKQYHMLGIHTQRAMLVVSIGSLFLAIICANAKPILNFMHQDPTVSEKAGEFAYFMIPSIFAFGLLQCLVKFLQTQNNVIPMVVSSGIVTLFHAFSCWILVFKSGLGSNGAALANSVSYWINLIFLALYVHFSSSCAKTWTGFSKEAMSNIFSFVKVSIFSVFISSLKAWTFQLMVFFSCLLPNPKLETSVLSICLNTSVILWLIPSALCSAVSTRVSNELGGMRPERAKIAVAAVLLIAVSERLVVGILMIGLRTVWGHLYRNEKEMDKYVVNMMPILATSSFLSGIQTVLSGAMVGDCICTSSANDIVSSHYNNDRLG